MDTPRLSDLSSSLPVAMLPSHSVRFGGFPTGGNAYSFTSSLTATGKTPSGLTNPFLSRVCMQQGYLWRAALWGVHGVHGSELCWQLTNSTSDKQKWCDCSFLRDLTTSEHKQEDQKCEAFKTNRKLYVLLEAVPFLRFCESEQASMWNGKHVTWA